MDMIQGEGGPGERSGAAATWLPAVGPRRRPSPRSTGAGSIRAIRGAPAAPGRALSALIRALMGSAKPEHSPQEARPVNPYCFDSCTHLEIMQNAI